MGKDAANLVDDVKTVQDLLNLVPSSKGGPSAFLNVDGLAFGKTQDAITRFQRVALGMASPDGRVDPGGRTLTKLGEFESNGSKTFRIARFELSDISNRTASSTDRFYEISAANSGRRVIYFFAEGGGRLANASQVLTRLRGRSGETNTFTTKQVHSLFAFQVKEALHSERDSSSTTSQTALSLPLPNDLLNIIVKHRLITPSTQVGVTKTVRGEFRPIGEAAGTS
ncbi:MAG TPA: hypothetical protein VHU40_13175 [Polyangia bacterium]|nr:hypothetical protein [Polyangia bacterium]